MGILNMRGVTKAKRPKMSEHRGRTWDTCTVILHDATEIRGYLDTSWGTRFYFCVAEQWYAGSIDKYQQPSRHDVLVDLRHPNQDIQINRSGLLQQG